MADNLVWSTLYLGNFADMDTDEGTNTVEDASALLTTFGAGPGNALANNITNVATFAGGSTDVNTNNAPTSDRIEYDIGGGTVSAQIDSIMVFAGQVTFYDGTTFNSNFGVIQDTNGNVFMLVLDSQPELASQGVDTVTFTSLVESNYGGVEQFTKDDHDFVCFTAGALIDTPKGPVRMDRLRVGDLVTTLDNGPQPVAWIGKRRVHFQERPHPGQPVLIKKDSLAKGLPKRDLMLSPNHRVLVTTSPAFALHDPLGALAPAKALTRTKGVRQIPGRREITYFSMLLPRHEVVIANGIAVESLYAGREVFASLKGAERSEWMRLAARDGRIIGAPPARMMLTTREARAGLSNKLLNLPEIHPVPLSWSLGRKGLRSLPEHLSARVQASNSASQ